MSDNIVKKKRDLLLKDIPFKDIKNREQIYKLRYHASIDELNKNVPEANHKLKIITDQLDTPESTLFDLIDVSNPLRLAVFNGDIDIAYHENMEFHTELDKLFKSTSLKKFSIKSTKGIINLTKREMECLKHLSKGFSVKEIARVEHLSPRTIETHITNVKHKTGCYSKSELVNLFQENAAKWL